MKNALILILIIFSFPLFAQNLNTMCGNGDFESGTLDPAEWSGYWAHSYQFSNGAAATPPWISGIISGASAIPGTIFNCTGVTGNCSGGQPEHVVTDHHTIIPMGNDPVFGALLSTVAPQPSVNNYSLRLGNACVGCGFEKIEKTFLVDPAAPNLSFWFAIVLIDGSHNNDNPGFQVRIFDQTTATDISGLVNLGNGSNTIIANAADNFFTQHPDNPSVLFRQWDCVQVDLSRQASHIVTVEFINRDCGACGHYAYTYLDNLCFDCSGSASGSIELDTIKSDTCGLPGEICINYTLPAAANATGDCQIDLTIWQNGAPLVVFNSPVLTSGSQYCFPLNSANLAALNTGLGGFDFTATGHFSVTDALGNTQVLPDKTVGTAPEGVDLGLNNDYELICGNQANCDSLAVTVTKLPGGECCYSVDLHNHQAVPIAYVEASLLSPDWAFASGYTAGLPFSWWPGSPGATSLPISITLPTGAHGIPQGDYTDALTYCFEPVVPGTTQPQVVVFTWYTFGPGGQGFVPICSDTIVKQCQPETDEPCVLYNGQIDCNPENPYEYFVNFTVTNQSGFTATHVSLDNLSDPVQFGFSNCPASDHLASIAIPLTPQLPNGATSGLLCVKITSLYPVLTPTTITLTLGLYSPTECCHNEMPVTITLQPCCEPCADIEVQENPISLPGSDNQCCYSLDIVNACAYQFFHKVETEIITPGIQFGYHAIGGPNAADWNMGGSSATSLIWVMNGTNHIPNGTTMDLIQFCIDDIDQASEVPQLIAIKWFTKDQFGQDSLACTDTLALRCDPVIDYHCLEVINQVLECSPQDSVYCYTFTVENTSSIPFGATNLDLFEVSGAALDFTGGGGTFPLPPLNPGDTIRLTVCFSTTPFPLPAGSELIFQYRLRYLMGDTCCYESALDTIPVPDCFSDTICPPKCCCYPSNIAIPTGLSPNNDGFNDVFFIQGTERCNNVTLTVYNRWGNVVYKKDLYDNSWAGTNQQGEDLPQGTYFILLTLHDSGASMSGFVDLRRE